MFTPPEEVRISGRPVLDVGGGRGPFPGADVVYDIHRGDVKGDVCMPLPFEDKAFAFSICSQVLEDVRDPVGLCYELQRVSKAGFIEVPQLWLEFRKNIDQEKFIGCSLLPFRGFSHHRWLCEEEDRGLVFTHKYPYPQFFPGLFKEPKGSDRIVFHWRDSFTARERLLIEPWEAAFFYYQRGLLRLPSSRVLTHQPCCRSKEIQEWEMHPCYFCGRPLEQSLEHCSCCGLMVCPSCGVCLCQLDEDELTYFAAMHFFICCDRRALEMFTELPPGPRWRPFAEQALKFCQRRLGEGITCKSQE